MSVSQAIQSTINNDACFTGVYFDTVVRRNKFMRRSFDKKELVQ